VWKSNDFSYAAALFLSHRGDGSVMRVSAMASGGKACASGRAGGGRVGWKEGMTACWAMATSGYARIVVWHAEAPACIVGLCRSRVVEADEPELGGRGGPLPLWKPLLEGGVVHLRQSRRRGARGCGRGRQSSAAQRSDASDTRAGEWRAGGWDRCSGLRRAPWTRCGGVRRTAICIVRIRGRARGSRAVPGAPG
jgi:hypothetical protein